MAEREKVRLVRCPKCENLLPEHPDYSVYQCGGCGAVLRAKKKVAANGGFIEKPGKGRNGKSLSEKEGGSLAYASETERESDGLIHARRKDRVNRGRTVNFDNNSLSRTENQEGLVGYGSRIEVEQNMGYQSGAEKENDFNGKYRKPLKQPIDADYDDMNVNRLDYVNSSMENGIGEPQFKSSVGALRSKVTVDRSGLGRIGLGEPYGHVRPANDRRKFPVFAYPEEGPSNYELGSSSYGYGKPEKKFEDLDRSHGFAYSEKDQTELLRKLEGLKEQLNRSCSVTVIEKQWDRNAVDRTIVPPNEYPGHNVSIQPPAPGKHFPKVASPYFKQYNRRPVSFGHGYDVDLHNFYLHSMNSPKEIPAYEDPFQQQIPRVHAYQSPCQYQKQPPHDYYFSRQHADFNQEPLAPHCLDNLHRQPACSCFHCYNNNWHVTSQAPPNVFGNRNFPKDPTHSNFNHKVNPVTFQAQGYNHQANIPALHSRRPQPRARWPSDTDSDIEGFRLTAPKKMAVARGKGRPCRPVAGGAPIIMCYNCFDLLKLPQELKVRKKIQLKLRCGSCSRILLLKAESKRLVIALPEEEKQIPAKADNESSDVSKEVLLGSNGCLNSGNTNCFDDFDGPNYAVGSADFKDNIPSNDRSSKLSEFDKRQHLTTSSSVSSVGEESLNSIIVPKDVSYSNALPNKDDTSPTFKGLPFHCLDDVSINSAINSHGKGNRSKRYDLDKNTSRQNSVKDMSVETEVEVSFNDYLNASASQDSLEIKKEENWSGANKGRESLFMGFIKRSLRDFSRSHQQLEDGNPEVFINGQPIPDPKVRRAEKLAGPIHAGDYWYDFRAGFWGVMGHPCLGIIPPYIKEFNYPLLENCADGNTGVFVNGRELNQKDLDLLATRGLPTTRDKFYTIDISGKVIDDGSGEELERLGRLVLTVEKMKCGFGMKVPRELV